MNINFFKQISLFGERKKQKYLVFVFIALIFLALLFFVANKLVKTSSLNQVETKKRPEVKIDFDFLKSKSLQDLSTFKTVPNFNDEVGRENPFIPY